MAAEGPASGADGAPATPIGPRLRAARQARRKTMEEVASAAGVTKGFLSRLERNQASASVAVLVRICAALDLSVGSLFEPAPAGEVLRKPDYPPIDFGGEGLKEYLLTPRGEQRLSAILSVLEPGGGSGAEPYRLPGDVEFALVLEGDVILEFDDPTTGTVRLAAGDTYTFDPGEPHTFCADDRGATVLWVISPGLQQPAPRS